jgi:hypothetical protein
MFFMSFPDGNGIGHHYFLQTVWSQKAGANVNKQMLAPVVCQEDQVVDLSLRPSPEDACWKLFAKMTDVKEGAARLELVVLKSEAVALGGEERGQRAVSITQTRKVCADGEPCKIELERDAEGNPQRWLEVKLVTDLPVKPGVEVLPQPTMVPVAQSQDYEPEMMCEPPMAEPVPVLPPPMPVATAPVPGPFSPAFGLYEFVKNPIVPVVAKEPAASEPCWMRAVHENGKCVLEIGNGASSKFLCEGVTMAVAEVGKVRIAIHGGQVQMAGPGFSATADQVAILNGAQMVHLKGDIRFCSSDGKTQVHVSEGQVDVHVADGRMEVRSAK